MKTTAKLTALLLFVPLFLLGTPATAATSAAATPATSVATVTTATPATPSELAQPPRGSIKGTVIDAGTGEPLIGTTIIIEGTTIGTVSDETGSFTISDITPGGCSITARYLGYEVFRQNVVVVAGQQIPIEIALEAEGIGMEDVLVVARIDNESENVILSGQKEALSAIQTVGAAEMSRKGIGDAQAAVSQISGISKQDGVKNVFVRGLGDRYNATYLNGFPLPSEDPEYKNIALEFFGSDIIQKIGVNKVFSAENNGDVGGAVIDIYSKQLIGKSAFSVSLDAGVNSEAAGADNFLKQDGVNYLGMSNNKRPSVNSFDFANSLDPSKVGLPLNHSYGISGGRRWTSRDNRHSLSFFAVATHKTDYSFSEETVKSAGSTDGIYQDWTGERSSIDISQLVLANVDYRIDRRHSIDYNFMLIHANSQYVGEFKGEDPRYGDADDGTNLGYMRRQQSNDNLLLTHQLITSWSLGRRIKLNVGAAYNSILGLEPDRRENNMSLLRDGRYIFTGSNRQRRFFSELDESDINAKINLQFKLKEGLDIERSNVTIGYKGRFVNDTFNATEYGYGMFPGQFTLDGLKFDNLYNNDNYLAGQFTLPPRGPERNKYEVAKYIHSAYVEATHQFTPRFAANVGFGVDYVDLNVANYNNDLRLTDSSIKKPYFLPSLSLRYDFTDEHSLRLGASKSYTLPQSKEISQYRYVNIGYASEGNKDLKPSDNWNIDLKWDWYPSSSELISLGAFYKYIKNPIGRVDNDGGSALVLSYNNIAPKADVAGLEFEMRMNLLNTTTIRKNMRRLSVGVNASYIYSGLDFTIQNTPERRSQLEGASPFLANADLSYNWSSGEKSFNVSVLASYFYDRVYTLGTAGFKDIMEEGFVTLAVVSSFRVNKFLTLKLKGGNLLNPKHQLTREKAMSDGKLVLNEFRKGIDVSFGISFDL